MVRIMSEQGYEADRARFLKLRFWAGDLDYNDASSSNLQAKQWKKNATRLVHSQIYQNLWRATAPVRHDEVVLTDADIERHNHLRENEADLLFPFVDPAQARIGLRFGEEQFWIERGQLLGLKLTAIIATPHGPSEYRLEPLLRSPMNYTAVELSPETCELASFRLLKILMPMAGLWDVPLGFDELSSY